MGKSDEYVVRTLPAPRVVLRILQAVGGGR